MGGRGTPPSRPCYSPLPYVGRENGASSAFQSLSRSACSARPVLIALPDRVPQRHDIADSGEECGNSAVCAESKEE